MKHKGFFVFLLFFILATIWKEGETKLMGQKDLERKTGSSPDSSEAQIIAAMSGKGGVGKTSLLINIAHFCACNGVNVLLVDCDLRTRGATAFFKVECLRNRGKDNIITTQRILVSLLSDNVVHEDKEDLQKLEVFNVEENFDFIPVLVGENLICEEKLDKDEYSSIEMGFANIVAGWEKNYRYIFFDFSAGYDRMVGFFCKYVNSICVVGKNSKIENEAFKILLVRLLKRYDKDDVVCCTNHYKTNNLEGRKVFHEFSGFPYCNEYAEEFDNGIMMRWGKNNQTKEMVSIVKNLLLNYEVFLDKYDKEIHIEQNRKVEKESPWKKIKRLEKKREKYIENRGGICIVSLILLITYSVIILLGKWEMASGWNILGIIILVLLVFAFFKNIYSVRRISKKINGLLSDKG